MITDEQLRDAIVALYERSWLNLTVFFEMKKPLVKSRHEDAKLNNSGTWVDVSVFIPDREVQP